MTASSSLMSIEPPLLLFYQSCPLAVKVPCALPTLPTAKRCKSAGISGRSTRGCEKRCKSAGISDDFSDTSRFRQKFLQNCRNFEMWAPNKKKTCTFAGILCDQRFLIGCWYWQIDDGIIQLHLTPSCLFLSSVAPLEP
ncbi:hypothetical protein D1872_284690 [compost metagenome]